MVRNGQNSCLFHVFHAFWCWSYWETDDLILTRLSAPAAFFLNTVGSKPLQRKNWRMQMASWCENLHAYRPCKVGSAESAMRCNIECLAVCVAASWVLYGFVIYIDLLWIQVYHERRLGRWRLGFGAVERGLNREGKCKVVVDSWGLWSIGAVWLKA